MREEVRAKQCTAEDFSDDEESQKYFRDWDGFSLFCPDLKEKEFKF